MAGEEIRDPTIAIVHLPPQRIDEEQMRGPARGPMKYHVDWPPAIGASSTTAPSAIASVGPTSGSESVV